MISALASWIHSFWLWRVHSASSLPTRSVAAVAACALLLTGCLGNVERTRKREAEIFALLDQACIDNEVTIPAQIAFSRERYLCGMDDGAEWIAAGDVVARTPGSRANWFERQMLWPELVENSNTAHWGEDRSGRITFFTTASRLAGATTSLQFQSDASQCSPTTTLSLRRYEVTNSTGPRCMWRVAPAKEG